MFLNRYRNKALIAIKILEDLDESPLLKEDRPRKGINLILIVENLTELGNPYS